MKTIIAPRRITDNFGDGFDKLFLIMEELRQLEDGEAVTIDMRDCVLLTPFFLLPFFLVLRKESERRQITILSRAGDYNFTGYLKEIYFSQSFNGFEPETYAGESDAILASYADKTYLPVINFPVYRTESSTEIRDHLLSCVNNVLAQQLGLKGPYRTGVMYLIDEAINNIVDHSGEERGFIFAQYFPSSGYTDICIGDAGTGILNSYQKAGKTGIITHNEAINSAANGISTKDRPEAEGRGFGISTSLDMLVNGLKGKYALLSGNAFLLKTTLNDEVTTIFGNHIYKGTLVALRVPSGGNPAFNPTNYFG